MVQKENFEKHDARAMSSSVQIRKKPSALANGVVTSNYLFPKGLGKATPARAHKAPIDRLSKVPSIPLARAIPSRIMTPNIAANETFVASFISHSLTDFSRFLQALRFFHS